MAKPSLPQGTRDFGPDVVRKRNYIFTTIKNIFELYGFQPLETPAMENLETLIGKYGKEGDKLIFKILNNGLDNPDKEKQIREDLEKVLEGKNVKGITERALKYDLTIPFARYVAMNHNQLTFPFKRYQLQSVWRADRPQRGRYREFYQCDADVVGSKSLLNEIELVCIYTAVFEKLNIEHSIKINNRKILQGIAEYCGCPDKLIEITTAIDKLDKIGKEKVSDELMKNGISREKINNIFDCVFIQEDDLIFFSAEALRTLDFTEAQIQKYLKTRNSKYRKDIEILSCLLGWFEGIENIPLAPTGVEGVKELIEVFEYLAENEININVTFDTTLARGLNYYTSTIFEVAAKKVKIGSIGGGGRYDDLTGLFGVPNIPGVGISFGVDRIYDVMEELNLFPADVHVGTQVLFFNLGENESKAAFSLMQQLRDKNIRCELYHENVKFDKQFKYAEKKNIPYAVIIGSKELEEQTCTIKNLLQSSQQTIPQQELLNYNF